MTEKSKNKAYNFAKRIQKKYSDEFDIIVIGKFSKNSAIINLKMKE